VTKIVKIISGGQVESTEDAFRADLAKQTPSDHLIVCIREKKFMSPTTYTIWKDEAEYHVTFDGSREQWTWFSENIGDDVPVVWNGIHTTLGAIDWDRYF
jgi:hypothetical protein